MVQAIRPPVHSIKGRHTLGIQNFEEFGGGMMEYLYSI
jgi:hypothetical protein